MSYLIHNDDVVAVTRDHITDGARSEVVDYETHDAIWVVASNSSKWKEDGQHCPTAAYVSNGLYIFES